MKRPVKRTGVQGHQTEAVRAQFLKITAEMRRIGMWDVPKLSPDQLEDMGAFGSNTMAFEQWLRWIFVPNVQTLLEKGGPWPTSSDVGAAAVRNFDGQDGALGLVTLLCEFDELFEGSTE
jgi:uncharacterized protein YqcC (DUF446 family)